MNKLYTAGRASAVSLLFWVIVTYCFAFIGAIAASQAGSFYAQLSRPGWAPPAWLFGPVWGVLYFFMALAVWRIWQIKSVRIGTSANTAITLYLVQLGLNALWTWLFFSWHLGLLAFVAVVLLWLLITATTFMFYRNDRLAAMLMLPYLAWVSFASVLCFSVWQRNPNLLG